MIFSSVQYLIFLPLVVLLYWRTSGQPRTVLLLVASYFFYMSWKPEYGILLAALTTMNWLLGLALGKASSGSKQSGHLLLFGVVLNLAFLCYYKYTNFFIQNMLAVVNSFVPLFHSSPVECPLLKIILPLGISFFVFEFIHYLIDVKRGSKPISSWMEFALFAAFFPSQIAGPIKRFQDFIKRFYNPEPWSRELFFEGMTLIVQGMFKKVAIADPIGWIIANTYNTYAPVSAGDSLIGIIGFTVQIFCDFSGYTDIGRGSALLLGIRLPVNFNLPFMSEDITEFWRRWHISLSTWIRDYVYISLGGSRCSYLATLKNLLVTMFICGLWHGAAWQFPIWGLMHGVGLVVNKIWKDKFLSKYKVLSDFCHLPLMRAFNVALTFWFVCVAFVTFRAVDTATCLNVIKGLANFHLPCMTWEYVEKSGILVLLAVYMGFWIASDVLKNRRGLTQPAQLIFPAPLRFASWTAALLLILAAKPTQATPFIYFQF